METHIPVLLKESIEGLNLKKNSIVIDATADGGGHAADILKQLGPKGKLIGLDWDPTMISRLKEKFRNDRRVILFHSNFARIAEVAESLKIRPDAIFFDLGHSTFQLYASGRGFSFQKEEPLLMTYDPETHPTAKELISKINEKDLADIIYKFGEERASRKISKAIINARQKKDIETAADLRKIIEGVLPRRGKLHPATKTFQALRIYVNHELENIEAGLKNAFEILKTHGRLAVISFHSLEDRTVKHNFIAEAKEDRAILITKKPIKPGREEILNNPRARSAKLRILEKHGKKNN